MFNLISGMKSLAVNTSFGGDLSTENYIHLRD